MADIVIGLIVVAAFGFLVLFGAKGAGPVTTPSLGFLLRHAVRHPVRTTRRNNHKTVDATGCGLGLLIVVLGFSGLVATWVASMILPLLI